MHPPVCLSAHPERHSHSNSLRISAIGLKFGGMMHSAGSARCLPGPMFPTLWYQSLCFPCSPVPMLPRNVSQSRCSPNLHYTVPVFTSPYVPPINWPVPIFPSAYVPKTCFPVLISQKKVFVRRRQRGLNRRCLWWCPKDIIVMPMTFSKVLFLQYGHSYYVFILNRYHLCNNVFVCAFSWRLERVTFEFGVVPI